MQDEEDKAIDSLKEAICIDLALNDNEETMDIAMDYKAMAEDLLKVERAEEAVIYIEKALAFEDKFYGSREDAQVQDTLEFLAEAFNFIGEYEKAVEVLEEIVTARTKGAIASMEENGANLIPILRMLTTNY